MTLTRDSSNLAARCKSVSMMKARPIVLCCSFCPRQHEQMTICLLDSCQKSITVAASVALSVCFWPFDLPQWGKPPQRSSAALPSFSGATDESCRIFAFVNILPNISPFSEFLDLPSLQPRVLAPTFFHVAPSDFFFCHFHVASRSPLPDPSGLFRPSMAVGRCPNGVLGLSLNDRTILIPSYLIG